jgi:hypothetical protein
MVIAAFLFVLSGMIASPSAQADGSIGDGTRPRLQRLELPQVKDITIDENGAASPAAKGSPEECSGFVLHKRDVREYFKRAGEVSPHDYSHMLDWSPCYASGKVIFKNGLTGTWGIQQLRAGSLALSDGRTLYLYCPKCLARAFAAP